MSKAWKCVGVDEGGGGGVLDESVTEPNVDVWTEHRWNVDRSMVLDPAAAYGECLARRTVAVFWNRVWPDP